MVETNKIIQIKNMLNNIKNVEDSEICQSLLENLEIDWLVKQAEKIEKYEETLENLEKCFDDFGRVSGDYRSASLIRTARSRLKRDDIAFL